MELGDMYRTGGGVTPDLEEAARWYRMACELDLSWACAVGKTYEKELNDPQEAVRWYRKAMEQGRSDGQMQMARLYHHGECGVSRDYAEAMRLYRLVAEGPEGPNVVVEYNIGLMHHKGQGVPQNYAEAEIWYTKAAVYGYGAPLYLFKLGEFLEEKGDNVAAHMWYNLAASQEIIRDVSEQARLARDAVSKKMEPAQILEAQHLASEKRGHGAVGGYP